MTAPIGTNKDRQRYDERVAELHSNGVRLSAAHQQAHREMADEQLVAWRAADPTRS